MRSDNLPLKVIIGRYCRGVAVRTVNCAVIRCAVDPYHHPLPLRLVHTADTDKTRQSSRVGVGGVN